MTIIKNPAAIRYHPFIAIHTDVADLIIQGAEIYRETMNIKSFSILAQLKMLEAYCEITDQRITMETLRSSAIEKILQGFMVIMAGKELVDVSDPSKYCRAIYTVLTSLKIHQPDLHQVTWSINNLKPDEFTCALFAKKATDFQRWYWAGWEIQQQYHPSRYLRLAQLVAPYGREFIESAYYEIEKHYRNRTNTFRPIWNNMFDYLNKHHATWPLKLLKTEAGLKSFMKTYTVFYFKGAEKRGIDAHSAIKNWNRFVDGVEVCLCKSGVLTNLSSPIKRPPSSTKHGSQTKIKETAEGLLIQEKLLTNIPLHVSDAEAIELLFFHIKNDLSTVRKWAAAQTADFKSRYNTRIFLAQKGTSIDDCSTRYAYKKYTLEDICATLEDINSTVPAKYLCKVYRHITNEKCSSEQLAYRFGLPLANSLLPFQCLLVLEHPEITTEFLKRFELYHKNGNLFGFDEDNRNLIGYKDRKQPDTREQIINLNDRSFNIVKDIIDITRTGRRKLKSENNDAYRYLFITSGASIRPFKIAKFTTLQSFSFINKRGLRERLIQEFRPHSDLPEVDLVEFILRVRLTRLRASRAVEIFIQTKSSERMSMALGHENYSPDLLSHYLPDPILAFIKARWIRIFQKAVVCEAMKDSPYLLRVTHFNSMDELDSFLEKHRINEIPSQASDPERKAQREEIDSSEAVFSIGVPFLASLLSLEAAVLASNNRERVCGRAEFWASFAEKIKTEIFSGSKRLLKQYLSTAIKMELSGALVDQLIDYIREDRRSIMKRFKDAPDHGFLFVTERGGRPLGIDSITTEFSLIRRAAGIEEQACAHLFRHAFCTNVVAELIAGIQAISPDSFRQTLMTNKLIAEHAMAKTGHSTLESLLVYVDSAFKLKSKYEHIIKHVNAAKTFEKYERRRKRLLEEFEKDKITKAQYLEREKSLTLARARDLDAT